MIDVITCKQWGARPPKHANFQRSRGQGFVIHHTAGPNIKPWPDLLGLERARCRRLARAIQSYHMGPSNNWADSGHHFLITRSGLVLEGRHGSLSAVQAGYVIEGAHAYVKEINQTWIGIEFEGTYGSAEIPVAQWDAGVEFISLAAFFCSIQSSAIEPHFRFRATQCPGTAFALRLPALRKAVHLRKWELMHDKDVNK